MVTARKQATVAKQRTLLDNFYRSDVRPQHVDEKSKYQMWSYDRKIEITTERIPSLNIDDVSTILLRKLRDELIESDYSKDYADEVVEVTKWVCRHKYPYRFLRRVKQSELTRLFESQHVSCLGKYHIERFKPALRWAPDYSMAQRHFHEWYGGPIELSKIDQSLLDRFEADVKNRFEIELIVRFKAEKKRCEVATRRARMLRNRIALVVNHWKPGRIAKQNVRARAFDWEESTVQYFAVKIFAKKTKLYVNKIPRLMHRLWRFNDNMPLQFAEFNEDKMEAYLDWARSRGNGAGGSLQPRTVDTDRCILNAISTEAATQALIRRPLRLLSPFEPQHSKNRRYVTAGRRTVSTVGHVKAASDKHTASAKSDRVMPDRVDAKKKGKTGPNSQFPHVKQWLLKEIQQGRDGEPADLRRRYRQEFPDEPLPSARKRTFSSFVSKARTKARTKA